MATRIVTLTLEVGEQYTNNQIHEALCKCIHEQNLDAMEELTAMVSDITVKE